MPLRLKNLSQKSERKVLLKGTEVVKKYAEINY